MCRIGWQACANLEPADEIRSTPSGFPRGIRSIRRQSRIGQSHRRAFAEETLIIAREATKVKEAVAGCNSLDAGLFRIGAHAAQR